MAEVKFTKSELRDQQQKLTQLERYLPTLQLKKAMLQAEVNGAVAEIERAHFEYLNEKSHAEKFQDLLPQKNIEELFQPLTIVEVQKEYECIAGVDIPHFKDVLFEKRTYHLFDTPYWFDDAVTILQTVQKAKQKIYVLEEKKRILEKELREVSIRVNLFEKIMIPRTKQNIKKIKVFLGDQQLAAVSQAKMAKKKLIETAVE